MVAITRGYPMMGSQFEKLRIYHKLYLDACLALHISQTVVLQFLKRFSGFFSTYNGTSLFRQWKEEQRNQPWISDNELGLNTVNSLNYAST